MEGLDNRLLTREERPRGTLRDERPTLRGVRFRAGDDGLSGPDAISPGKPCARNSFDAARRVDDDTSIRVALDRSGRRCYRGEETHECDSG